MYTDRLVLTQSSRSDFSSFLTLHLTDRIYRMKNKATMKKLFLGLLALSWIGEASSDTIWDINVREDNKSCELVAYHIDDADESYGVFTVGFYYSAEMVSVPGYELPKSEPFLLIRTGPEPGKSSSYVKPDAVIINDTTLPTYQWDESSDWDPTFFFVAGPSAVSLFEASRRQEPIPIKLESGQSDDRMITVSTAADTSFPILADMLETCGETISRLDK